MTKSRGRVAYTRKEYVRSIPPARIARFTVGEPLKDYEYTVALAPPHDVEINESSLEAGRVTANKVLTNTLGDKSYLLRVCIFPHQIVREHKAMGFAGADRLSQGMRRSFGKPTKKAAKVSANQKIISVDVYKERVDLAKEAMKRASKKISVPTNIVVEQLIITNNEA
ncbi:MAG: large subunit ribosomal protein L10e [Thermoproteota archaeon]|nr:large subunit ribosomal protein L10e [Thermoproteota archaeon]